MANTTCIHWMVKYVLKLVVRTVHRQAVILGNIMYSTVLGDSSGIVLGLLDQSATSAEKSEIVFKYSRMEIIFFNFCHRLFVDEPISSERIFLP